jgi:phosphoribosyl-AMP cyclohydrolase
MCGMRGFCLAHVVIVQQTNTSRCERVARRKETGLELSNSNTQDREQGSAFLPKFDDRGLLTAVVTDADSLRVLMVAFMDREALAKTRETGLAHFHSRSRGKLWLKGETSGHVLQVEEILVDCDQDALVIRARPAGPTCHTGATSCFYRKLEGDSLVSVNT